MLLASVVLHGVIAFLPLKKAPLPPEQAVLESPLPITVTCLPEPPSVAISDSADAQPVTSLPITPPPPIAPQPVIPQPAEVLVIPQPVALSPEPPPVIVEPSSNVAVEDIPDESVPDESAPDEDVVIGNEGDEPRSPQSNEAEIAAMATVWEGFLGSLQNGLSESSLQQILSLFGQPGQEDLFFDANQQPKISIVSHHLLDDKTPEQVFEEVLNVGLDEQEGFEVRDYGEFAGGPVYEVMQGEVVHYLNIVPLNDRSGSVLIVCDRPPNV